MRKGLMKHAKADNNDGKALKKQDKEMIKLYTKAQDCMKKSNPYQKKTEAKA